MTVQYHVFDSKVYLERRGIPNSPRDLDRHDIIDYDDDLPAPVTDLNWLLEAGSAPGARREPALRVSSVYGIYRAVLSGLGIVALPYYVADQSPTLLEKLPKAERPSMDAYLGYPEELRHSRRIAALRDFLVEGVREDARRLRLSEQTDPILSGHTAPVTV